MTDQTQTPKPAAKPEPVYEDIPETPPIYGEAVDETPKSAANKLMIVDEKSGELIPRGAMKEIVMPEIVLDFTKVGTLKLTPEEEAILAEPFKEEEFLIRPEGMLYIQWTLLNNRLNKAFGRFQHSMLPQGGPQAKDEGDKILILHSWWLFVRGVPVTWATGECTYYKSNFAGSYGDAIEGAKSNAFMRCCKNLNIGDMLRMWDHEFGEEWKKKFAEYGPFGRNNKMIWRKRQGPPKTMKDFIAALVPSVIPTQAELSAFTKRHNIGWTVQNHDKLIAHVTQLWRTEHPPQKSAAQAEEDINDPS